jgi:hypothetical protein
MPIMDPDTFVQATRVGIKDRHRIIDGIVEITARVERIGQKKGE